MDQKQKADLFQSLHVKGDPVILYNIWDAGSAKAVAEAGANAIATGSQSVAAAQGYPDGQSLPMDRLLAIVERIVDTTDLPVTVDFEGGYAQAPEAVAENVAQVVKTGAVGINFEDQVVGSDEIYGIEEQAGRIRAIRKMADEAGLAFYINARTDLFLKSRDPATHPGLIAEAKERAQAYAEAGASGFFAPLLSGEGLIADLCEATDIPVNIMQLAPAPSNARLAQLGVARISYGPVPYIQLMETLTEKAKAALQS